MANQKDKIRIDEDTKEKLEVKKALYGCTSYSKTVNVCIERLDAIEKMVDMCAGDETDVLIYQDVLFLQKVKQYRQKDQRVSNKNNQENKIGKNNDKK